MTLLAYPPLNAALIDDRTGLITRPWQQWFRDLHIRTGGNNAPNIDELIEAPYITAAVSEILTQERVVTDTATVAWDITTSAQAKANVPNNSITFAKMQDLPGQRLMGNSALVTSDPEAIALGDEFSLLDGLLTMTSLPFLPQGMVAEQVLWTATNATFGTGIALSSNTRTSFSATEAALILRNTDAADGATVYPVYVSLLCTDPGDGGTSAHLGVVVDPANRYSSGGTLLTAFNAHTGNGDTSVASVRFGNVTASAAVSPRRIARPVAKTASRPNWVIGDQVVLTFGNIMPASLGLLAGDSPASQIVIPVPPVALAPGSNHSLLLHYWAPGQTAAPSFEVTVAWMER